MFETYQDCGTIRVTAEPFNILLDPFYLILFIDFEDLGQ